MGLEHVICEIALHTALPSELSISGSWANAILYPILRTSTFIYVTDVKCDHELQNLKYLMISLTSYICIM